MEAALAIEELHWKHPTEPCLRWQRRRFSGEKHAKLDEVERYVIRPQACAEKRSHALTFTSNLQRKVLPRHRIPSTAKSPPGNLQQGSRCKTF